MKIQQITQIPIIKINPNQLQSNSKDYQITFHTINQLILKQI